MTDEKVVKAKLPVFHPKKFKQAISNDEDAINALKQFMEMYENPDCEQDLVLELLESENESGDIVLVKMLDSKRVISELTVIFKCFNLILNRIGDDLGKYELWGLAFIKQLLYPSRVHCLKEGLSDGIKPSQKRETLELLTNMVALSEDSAKEVMRNFPPNINFIGPLLLKFNIKDEVDVCTATLDFLISFLTHENSELAVQLLESRSVLNSAFPVLKYVRASVIECFLGALLSQIVNKRIKTLKCALFNNSTLLDVMKLFKWNGPVVYNKRNKTTAKYTASEEETTKVRQLARRFVLTLLCSRDGVTFHDPFCGTSETNYNHMVTNLLPSAYAQINSPTTVEVIVQVLKKCPDQIHTFFDQLKQNLEPRLTITWATHMELIRKVIASQDLVQIQSSLDPLLAPDRRVNVILLVTTASVFKSSALKLMFHNPNIVMRHQALLYVETVLNQVTSFFDNDEQASKPIGSYQMMLKDFQVLLWNRLSTLLPSFVDLCDCWSLATERTDSAVSEVGLLDSAVDLSFTLSEHFQKLIDVLAIHHRMAGYKSTLHTAQLAEIWNSTKHINRLLDADQAIDIQVRLSKLVINAGLGKSLLLQKINGRNTIYFMLELISQDLNMSVRTMLSSLLEQFLLSTGNFDPDELKMILRRYLVRPVKSDFVLHYLHDIFVELVENFQAILDSLNSLRESDLQEMIVDGDSAFENIFEDHLASDCQSDDPDISEFKISTAVVSQKPHLSPFVFFSLKCLNSVTSDKKDPCENFLNSFMYDVLHCHDKPDTFCWVLRQCQQKLPNKFSKYIEHFDTSTNDMNLSKENEFVADVVDSEDFSTRIRVMFEINSSGSEEFVDDDAVVSALSVDELFIVFRQSICYTELLLKKKNGDEALFGRLCAIAEKLIAHLKNNLLAPNGIQTFDFDWKSTLLHRMETAVIQSPSIMDAFLNWDSLVEQSSKKSRAVSDLVLKLASDVSGCKSTNLIAANKVLYDKAIAFIQRALLYTASGNGRLKLPRLARISLVSILEPFISSLPLPSIQQMVAGLPIEALASSTFASRSGLNECGLLLTCILDHVARDGRKHRKLAVLSTVDSMPTADGGLASGDVAQALHLLLISNRYFTFLISKESFEFVLNNLSLPVYNQLALLLLSSNPENLDRFADWVISSAIPTDGSHFHCLALFYFHTVIKDSKRHLACAKTCRVATMLAKFYWQRLRKTILEASDENNISDQLKSEFLIAIVELKLIDAQELKKFCESCVSTDLRLASANVARALRNAFLSVSDAGLFVLDDHPVSRFVVLCLKLACDWFVMELSDVSVSRDRYDALIEATVKDLTSELALPDLGELVHREKLTQKLVKTTLKLALKDRTGDKPLHLLIALLQRLMRDGQASHFMAGSIFELLLGHSNFLPGFLSKAKEDREWREHLLDLLLLLTSMDPSVCRAALIPIYLSAYGASLDLMDQKLLRLMYTCEAQGISMHQYRPFLWGDSASSHYAIMKDLRHTLLKQPSAQEILSLLDPQRLLNTAHNFPLQLKLDLEDATSIFSDVNPQLYDPRFLLPLFSQLTAPESLLFCIKFIECNALAVVFAALGSFDGRMRAAAYHVIENFYIHLEGARFMQAPVWLYLLDWLANGIKEKNCQLSNIITIFLIEISRLLLVPSTPILRPMIFFMTIKPSLNIYRVPNFYQMFNMPDQELHDKCRGWILALLRRGLREPNDYAICNKYYAFKVMLSFLKSPLSSAVSRSQILEVVFSAVKLKPVACDLFTTKGLAPFLLSVLRDCDAAELVIVVQILAAASKAILQQQGSVSVDAEAAGILHDVFFMLVRSLAQMNPLLPTAVLQSSATTMASIVRWSQSSDGKRHSPGMTLTTSCVERLVEIYVLAFDQSDRGQVKKLDDTLASNRLDDTEVLTHPICEMKLAANVCFLLVNWNCVSSADTESAIHKSSLNIFIPVCRLLLDLSLRSDDVVVTLGSVYRWLEQQVRLDQSDELVALLANQESDHDGCVSVVDLLLRTYGCLLLSSVTEVAVGGTSTSTCADSKRESLLLLNGLFLLLKKKLRNREVIKNDFLQALTACELKQLAKKMKSKDDEQKGLAAVATAKLFLELWQKKDVEIMFAVVEKFLVSSQPLSNQPKRSSPRDDNLFAKPKKRKLVRD